MGKVCTLLLRVRNGSLYCPVGMAYLPVSVIYKEISTIPTDKKLHNEIALWCRNTCEILLAKTPHIKVIIFTSLDLVQLFVGVTGHDIKSKT